MTRGRLFLLGIVVVILGLGGWWLAGREAGVEPSGRSTASKQAWFSRGSASPGSSDEEGRLAADAQPRTIRGTVVEAVTGTAVPAEVRLLVRGGEEADSVWADEKGRFEFPPTTSRVEQIAAKSEGYAVAVAFVREADTEVHLLLDRAVRFRGKVVDPAGEGIGGAWVIASDTEGGWPRPQSSKGTTGEDGTFELADAPSGELMLQAGAEGFTEESIFDVASVGPGRAVDDVSITLKPAGSVAGRVTANGEPVKRAMVEVKAPQDPDRKSYRPAERVWTDEKGDYGASGILPGPVVVYATQMKFGVGGKVVEVGRGSVARADIELLPVGLVEGVVQDAAGRPVAGATLLLTCTKPSKSAMERLPEGSVWANMTIPAVSGEDGSFAYRGIAHESAHLRIRSPGYVDQELKGLVPPAIGLVIRLETGASIDGTVTDADGNLWKGSGVVTARPASGEKAGAPSWHDAPQSRRPATGRVTDGRFRLDALADDTYEVSFHHAVAGGSQVESVEARVGSPKSIALVLRAQSKVVGRVVSSAKVPIPGAHVGIGELDRRGESLDLVRSQAVRSGPAGRFTLPFAGNGSVIVYHPEFVTVARRDVIAAPGDTIDVGDIELQPGRGRSEVAVAAGIGIQLVSVEGKLQVSEVTAGSGAELGGVKAGDVLKAIDGSSTEGLRITEAGSLLMGEPATTVHLTLQRSEEVVEADCVRTGNPRSRVIRW